MPISAFAANSSTRIGSGSSSNGVNLVIGLFPRLSSASISPTSASLLPAVAISSQLDTQREPNQPAQRGAEIYAVTRDDLQHVFAHLHWQPYAVVHAAIHAVRRHRFH